jgi:FkbM family methyltransferase
MEDIYAAIYLKLPIYQVESIIRSKHKDNIFTIKHDGKIIKFYLPNIRDLIQLNIILMKEFYEHKTLEYMRQYVPKDAVILDIGANIGNHTVFYGKIMNARVYAFEPQKDVFQTLNKNIILNSLENVVSTFNFGLGERNSKASLGSTLVNNCGGTSIVESDSGELEIKTLDSLNIPETIDFIKIDVEGAELGVLKGALQKIKTDRPIIIMEVEDNHYLEVVEFMSSIDYAFVKEVSKTNCLFIHK